MKTFSLFLISITLFCGVIKLLKKSKADLRFFTQQEQEILNLIAVGYRDNEIAELVHTSERSIQKYKSNVLRKMNMHDISSAIQYALEKGLLSITYA